MIVGIVVNRFSVVVISVLVMFGVMIVNEVFCEIVIFLKVILMF